MSSLTLWDEVWEEDFNNLMYYGYNTNSFDYSIVTKVDNSFEA